MHQTEEQNIMQVIGLDVGGAHLKVAALLDSNTVEHVFQLPCPLWKGMDHLTKAWREARARITPTPNSCYAVTMTGELADCFVSREDGVSQILDFWEDQLPQPFQVYTSRLGLVDPSIALSFSEHTASANWHASARCVARHYRHGIFMDIGSTTTDIIPFTDSVPRNWAYTDHDRLAYHELIYSGVLRTPVMAMVQSIQLAGKAMPVVAEHFATAADVYRLTGDLPAYCDQHATSDYAPATPTASARRLARMVACDFSGNENFWVEAAKQIAEQHYQTIFSAYTELRQRERSEEALPVVAAGVGRFIAKRLARDTGSPYYPYASLLSASSAKHQWLSDCASAVSVARLLHQSLLRRSYEPTLSH